MKNTSIPSICASLFGRRNECKTFSGESTTGSRKVITKTHKQEDAGSYACLHGEVIDSRTWLYSI